MTVDNYINSANSTIRNLILEESRNPHSRFSTIPRDIVRYVLPPFLPRNIFFFPSLSDCEIKKFKSRRVEVAGQKNWLSRILKASKEFFDFEFKGSAYCHAGNLKKDLKAFSHFIKFSKIPYTDTSLDQWVQQSPDEQAMILATALASDPKLEELKDFIFKISEKLVELRKNHATIFNQLEQREEEIEHKCIPYGVIEDEIVNTPLFLPLKFMRQLNLFDVGFRYTSIDSTSELNNLLLELHSIGYGLNTDDKDAILNPPCFVNLGKELDVWLIENKPS